jgi:hypothetical protein
MINFYLFLIALSYSFVNIYTINNHEILKNRNIANDPFDNSTLGWFQTFEDNFDDKDVAISKGTDSTCFTGTASCLIGHSWSQLCSDQYDQQLKNLNKCNWNVYSFYNYMDFGARVHTGHILYTLYRRHSLHF